MSEEKITKSPQDEFVLVNIVEKLVVGKVDEMIGGMDMCGCERCRQNASAIALNALPPHYVTTKRGALLADIQAMEVNYRTKVTIEVTKALMMVKNHPLH